MSKRYIIRELTALCRGFALATLSVLACLALEAGNAKAPAGKGGNVAFAQSAPGVPEIYVIDRFILEGREHLILNFYDPPNGGAPTHYDARALGANYTYQNGGPHGYVSGDVASPDGAYYSRVGNGDETVNRMVIVLGGGGVEIGHFFGSINPAYWINSATNTLRIVTSNGSGSSTLFLTLTHSSDRMQPTTVPREFGPGFLTGTHGEQRGKLALTWLQGVENGGGRPIAYEISYRKNPYPWQPQDNELIVVTVTANEDTGHGLLIGAIKAYSENFTITGLVNGRGHSFTIRASNQFGLSDMAVASGTPRGAPEPVSVLSAYAGYKAVSLHWKGLSCVDNGGEKIVNYHIRYGEARHTVIARKNSPSNPICQNPANSAREAYTLTITSGLVLGQPNVFSVYAENALGYNDPLLAGLATATPFSLAPPRAPVSVSVAAGLSVATLFWQPPTETGGASITAYVVVVNSATTLALGGRARTATIAPLQGGVFHTLGVAAQNSLGIGHTATIGATVYGPPAAPGGLSVASRDGALRLSWDAPPKNGGASIASYVVYVNNTVSLVLLNSAARAATVLGLVNGTQYTLGVAAQNAFATGTVAAIAATPMGPPGAPQSLAVAPGAGFFLFTWAAPANNGGVSITAYVVDVNGATSLTLGAPARAASLVGLAFGESHTLGVAAQNSLAVGATATLVFVTAAPPGAPASLRAQRGDSLATLTWGAPAQLNGAALQGYEIAYDGQTQSVGASATGYTATGLSNGTEYEFSVYAKSDYGNGATATARAKPATTPATPSNLRAGFADGEITLRWDMATGAAETGGEPITAYIIRYGANLAQTAGAATSAVIGSLTNGETIAFSVYAVNVAGESAPPATIAEYASALPGAPTSLRAAEGNGAVTLTWGAPVSNGGASITAYMAEWNGQSTLVYGLSLVVSGLTNGRTASFTLRARNRNGLGAAANTAAAGRDKPSPPTAVNAVGASGVITLTWNAPLNDNGAAVTGYIVSYKGAMTAKSGRGFTLSGLSAGETVRFTVQAVNSVGVSDGATAEGVARDAPSAPTNLQAQRGNGVATLTWGAPAQLNGATLQGYEIAYDGQTQSVGASATGYTATGLSNGTEYEFRVYAKSNLGDGAAAITSAKPATTPATPSNLRAGFADGAITLRWDMATGAAETGGEPITAYIVRYGANLAQTVGAATSAVISGLANGEAVAFSVYAVNVVGESATPATVNEYANAAPGAPTGLQAQDGDGVITLQWSAPSATGGAAITAYIVEYTGGSLTAAGNRATLTGLTNGAPITSRVFAVNRGGRGLASLPVVATAATTAGAPTGLRAAEGNGVVTLTWGAPSDNGGASVTAYLAEWNGQSTLVYGLSLVVSGLTNGRTASFTLRARNRKGLGAAASTAAAGRGRPSRPTAVSAAGASGVITLTWNAPTNDNGAAVTGYIVSYKGAMTAKSGRGFTLSGLSAGETVRFTVQAVNSVGVSDGATAEGVARDAPSAPTNLQAQRGNGVATLTWGAPAQLNGATLQGYEIAYDGQTQSVGASATGYTATGLSNGTEYEFRVYAKSNLGDGAAAITSAKPATTPATPSNLRAGFADGAITLRWDMATGAAETGGEPITAYIVRYGANLAQTVGAATSAVISGLTNGEAVAFSVYAVNVVGESATPAIVNEYANAAPGAPTGLQAQDGDGVITLQWSAPSATGGAAITAYIVEYTGGSLTAAGNRATLTGLTNGAPITSRVFAVNRGGRGLASLPVVATAATTAGAPTGLRAAEGNGVVTLTWGAPSDNGGASVTAYLAEWNGQSTLVYGLSLVVLGLTNGRTASFTLRARNRKGLGAAASTAAAGRGRPSRPTAVSAAGASGVITLTWNAPTNDNGAAVTGYIVSYKGLMTTMAGRSFTLSGLSAGETVRFTVQAVNSVGVSDGAAAEGVASDDGPSGPSAPTNLQAQRGNGVATLTWGAPAQLNGAALQGYEIAYDGQTQSVGASATGYTATGLSNGTEYEFRVYAKSDLGDGAAAIAVAKPATTPATPSNLRAMFADRAITLQWDMATGAAETGGEPITAYIVRYGQNQAKTVGAVASAVIDGLSNGETIAFSVYALNVAGEGAPPATIAEYASAPPGAPAGLQAAEGDGVITLEWSAPSATGGAAITAYIVEYTGGSLTAAGIRATLTGLTNGEEITIRVYAVNRAGRGLSSAPQSKRAATTPGAVFGLSARGADRSIELSWNGANNGGAEITRYMLYLNGLEVFSVLGASRAAIFSGLTNGEEYTLGIRAENTVGMGPMSETTETPASRPGTPRGFSVVAGVGELSLYWEAPASDGGASITAYMAFVDGVAAVTVGRLSRSALLSGLTNGKSYVLGLAAANKRGVGLRATASETPYTVPGAPRDVSSRGGEGGVVSVFWRPPASDNGRPVLGYGLSLNYVGGAMTMTVEAGEALMSASFTIDVSVAHSVYVRARNLAGYGSWVLAVDEEDFLLMREADNNMLPGLAGALSRRWGKALGGRLGAGGGVGDRGVGANLRAFGANFSSDDKLRGFAEMLRKRGGALAKGEEVDELALRNASFALPPGVGGGGLGAAGGSGGGALGGAGLWGGMAYAKLKDEGGKVVWDGEHINYHAGFEGVSGGDKLVGVMLTRDEIKTKYRTEADGDYKKYNLRAGGAHPYFLWSAPAGDRRLWAAAGHARGKVETFVGETAKTRDLRVYSAFGGFYGLLWSGKNGGVLDMQTDIASARLKVENGGEATARNLRMLLEMRREFRDLEGNAFFPFLRAGWRLQDAAAGWEASGGLRWTDAANWRGKLSGGASGLRGANNKHKEWSVEGVLSKAADPLGKGLALDLRAQYGGKARDATFGGDFWRPLVEEERADAAGGFGFGADLGYGITGVGALWRPYFGAIFGAGGERRAGLAWRQLLRADVEARAGMEAKSRRDKTQLNVNLGVKY